MLTRRSTCGAPRHQESRIRCNHNTTNRSCVPSIIGGELNHRWAQEIVIQETNKHSPIHMETTIQSPSVSSQWAKASSRFFSPSSPPNSSTSSATPLRLKRCLPVHNDASILRPEKKRPCIFCIFVEVQHPRRTHIAHGMKKETYQNTPLCADGIPELHRYDTVWLFLQAIGSEEAERGRKYRLLHRITPRWSLLPVSHIPLERLPSGPGVMKGLLQVPSG